MSVGTCLNCAANYQEGFERGKRDGTIEVVDRIRKAGANAILFGGVGADVGKAIREQLDAIEDELRKTELAGRGTT